MASNTVGTKLKFMLLYIKKNDRLFGIWLIKVKKGKVFPSTGLGGP
jgi:hypothetical protein